jgi:GWxTD domain-containing protein
MPHLTRFVCFLLFCSTIAATPVDPATALQEARGHIASRRHAAAASLLEEAIATASDYTDSKMRSEALAALHFYAAVAYTETLNEAKAREHIRQVFELRPTMRISDASKYPRRFVQLFNDAAATREPVAAPAPGGRTFAAFYPGYESIPTPEPDPTATGWGPYPVMELLALKDEKREWAAISTPDAREAFIARFWLKRDPTADTPENEFREEFERRMTFANRVFPPGGESGSVSDRGRVFLLLGAPALVERRPITEDDVVQITERFTTINGTIERWVFRSEQLPVPTSRQQVQFRFFTQKGLGDGVLQRDDAFGMQALLSAAAVAAKGDERN